MRGNYATGRMRNAYPIYNTASSASVIPLTNLYQWLKADAGVYSDAGVTLALDTEAVQQWNDQSGNARHASQAVAGSRPVYTLNSQNSLPGLTFASDGFDLADTYTFSSFTVFMIVKETGGGSTAHSRAGQTKNYYGIGGTADLSLDSGDLISVNPAANNAAHFYAGKSDGATASSIYEDTQVDLATASDWIINGIGHYNTGLIMTGVIYEIILYDAFLGASDFAQVKSYLKTKWGIA